VRIYLTRGSTYRITTTPRVNKEGTNLMIKVSIFDRYDTLYDGTYYDEFQEGRTHAIRDERRLYKSGLTENIFADQIDGKCHVRLEKDIKELDKWKEEPDRWWVSKQVPKDLDPRGVIRRKDLSPFLSLAYAKQTEEDLTAQHSRMERFRKLFPKLRALDMFAGGGGMSIGVDRTGIAETLWVVEFSEAGCATLRQNLHGAKVYNTDGNVFLDRAIRLHDGEILEPLRDCHGDLIPDPPRKGEVEIIFGGT